VIKYITGDLFDFIDGNTPVVIAHVCNNKGGWGAGFVIPLGEYYPIAKSCYVATAEANNLKLGTIQIGPVSENVYVSNMVAQTLGGLRPLYYNALCQCMDSTVLWMKDRELDSIICPKFGSGLAGGSWTLIEQLIIDCWIRAGINVTVVKFTQKEFQYEDINKEKDWTY
jgi:O-acetyl-ADP-ribose deacetylase (regulator of RNase III)